MARGAPHPHAEQVPEQRRGVDEGEHGPRVVAGVEAQVNCSGRKRLHGRPGEVERDVREAEARVVCGGVRWVPGGGDVARRAVAVGHEGGLPAQKRNQGRGGGVEGRRKKRRKKREGEEKKRE